ncbi:phosphoadenosine phosphosulfate reductase [Friedmanniella endophytica]|uniref:Adenosine 5'-phosphosulfate reductase n=1 Tax=Microlunatus kandeliicorticis TaxID=1759536 RepID=A0A7W3ITF4_9ACTN|nr:phosphoadenylyl-sulfate reductase [Microlunatus kandeliicorticis]MBA8794899.1 phosphoadenosine phosphosulfate reductase [Microlunatus kandeliicorticis]
MTVDHLLRPSHLAGFANPFGPRSDKLTSQPYSVRRPVRQRSTDKLETIARDANMRLAHASAQEILAWGFEQFGYRMAVTSSMADTVMVHLAEQVAPGIDVIFLDTGYHFAETIGTRDAVEAMFDVHVVNVTPEQTVAQQDAAHGKDLFATNPDLCCKLRKVEPLNRVLAPYDAWATGVRRADSRSRARTQVVSYSPSKNMIRIAPIAGWSDQDVADYIERHGLIINPLLEDGYPSVGCEPCTSRPVGDDPRSGRWAGLGKSECGIQL